MNQQPLYDLGHPAYVGDNRFEPGLTTGETLNALKARGINAMSAVSGMWEADKGTHVTFTNHRGSVIELVRKNS